MAQIRIVPQLWTVPEPRVRIRRGKADQERKWARIAICGRVGVAPSLRNRERSY
jgi:hypothetical protein